MLKVTATVEPFENGRGFSLRVLRGANAFKLSSPLWPNYLPSQLRRIPCQEAWSFTPAALATLSRNKEKGPERAMEDWSIKPDCLAAAETAIRTFRAGPSQDEANELGEASVILDRHLDDPELDADLE